MLRKLTPEKAKVSEAMIFCIEHAEAYEEIIDFITESLNSPKTSIPKRVSCLTCLHISFLNLYSYHVVFCSSFCYEVRPHRFFSLILVLVGAVFSRL